MATTLDIAAFILAGGQSRRMGRDKALLPYGGVPLIQHLTQQLQPHVEHIAVVSNDRAAYDFLGLDIVPDLDPGCGPLMGIASALSNSEFNWNLVLATDIPDIPAPLLQKLYRRRAAGDCVVPREPSGRLQPLCALYHKKLTDEILSILSSGEHRVMAALDLLAVETVPIDTGTLCNLNTPDAYRRAIES